MAKLTIEVPDEVAQRVLASFCAYHGYRAQLLNLETNELFDNPETPKVFARRQLVTYVKASVRNYESTIEAENARAVKMEEVDKIEIT